MCCRIFNNRVPNPRGNFFSNTNHQGSNQHILILQELSCLIKMKGVQITFFVLVLSLTGCLATEIAMTTTKQKSFVCSTYFCSNDFDQIDSLRDIVLHNMRVYFIVKQTVSSCL